MKVQAENDQLKLKLNEQATTIRKWEVKCLKLQDEIVKPKATLRAAQSFDKPSTSCLPRIIRTALRDICMHSLKLAVNLGILANINEGEDRKNYKDYDIDTVADILSIGAIFLAHLLDTEPLGIDSLEKLKIVHQAEFHE